MGKVGKFKYRADLSHRAVGIILGDRHGKWEVIFAQAADNVEISRLDVSF